ncbi:helix-turn-helix domain-containing protein [Actinomadura sp. 6N118]|uniref:helix-turn-helix domain-containing protein n=1 Tax=Actinomadura sp. 6N118 TaxID=3375151 RepID=UPI00378BB1EF
MGSADAAARVCVSCCETWLSRYNSEPLCAACQQAARDASGITPRWLWDSSAMRAALARADIAAVLALLRAAAGLSQDDLGLLVGKSQATISLAERGQRATFFDIRELLALVDAVGMPREALTPLIAGKADARLNVGDDVGGSVVDVTGEQDVQRREFHGLAIGVLAGLALPTSAPPPQIGRAHLQVLRASIDQLRRRGRTVGGRAILGEAVGWVSGARAMLDGSDYNAEHGRELLALTADLGLVAGWHAYDSGDQRLARWLYGEAALLAGSVGDDQLAAHVFANMAQQSIHLASVTQHRGTAREALRLAERAGSHARHDPSPKLHAVVELRKAHAQLGDATGFRAAICAARRELDRGEHSSDPAWGRFITASEITGYEAMGLQRLGGGKVADLFRDVVGDAERSPRDRAFYRAALAGALLDGGDRAAAIDEGLQLLPDLDGGTMTSTRVLNKLRPVRAAVGAGPSSEEFRIRFDGAAQTLSA